MADINIEYLERIAAVHPMHNSFDVCAKIAREGVAKGCDNEVLTSISRKQFGAVELRDFIRGHRTMNVHRLRAFDELKRLTNV